MRNDLKTVSDKVIENFSSSAKRSACALTLALMASASSSLFGSFLSCPISIPTCLLSALRWARSSLASVMAARFFSSSSSTSSTRGSLAS